MKRLLLLPLLMLALAAAGLGHDGQQTADKGPFRRQQLTPNTYILYGRGGNIGFIVTKDGAIVIDDQFEDVAPSIVTEIKSVTAQPVKFLINTHHHGDHTGGNATFLKIAYIIAHENVRKNMLHQPGQTIANLTAAIAREEKGLPQLEQTDAAKAEESKKRIQAMRDQIEKAKALKLEDIPAPNITFQKEVRLYIGGEEVQVFHVKRGHTDGDSIIYFPNQKVAHMGDLCFNQVIPFIDRPGGADTREWIETLDAVLSRVDPQSQFIPGHGEVTDAAGLRAYRQYLSDLRAAVAGALQRNPALTRDDALKQINLDQYRSFGGYDQRFASNVGVVYDEMKAVHK